MASRPIDGGPPGRWACEGVVSIAGQHSFTVDARAPCKALVCQASSLFGGVRRGYAGVYCVVSGKQKRRAAQGRLTGWRARFLRAISQHSPRPYELRAIGVGWLKKRSPPLRHGSQPTHAARVMVCNALGPNWLTGAGCYSPCLVPQASLESLCHLAAYQPSYLDG